MLGVGDDETGPVDQLGVVDEVLGVEDVEVFLEEPRSGVPVGASGSRTSIAAGTLPNNRGTLASWVSASQNLKPGNLMPSMNIFSGEELRAIAAYLESLK